MINEYDWEYVVVMLNDQVKGLFVKQFDGIDNSLEKKWGCNFVICIKVNSIVFNGLDEECGVCLMGVIVWFEKWKFDKSMGKSEYFSSYVGMLCYEYKVNLCMEDNLCLCNLLGFQVMVFKVDDEFNVLVFKVGEQDVGMFLFMEEEGVLYCGVEVVQIL